MTASAQGIPAAARLPWWRRAWNELSVLFASRVAVIGLILVLFWVLAAIFAPLLTPYSPSAQDGNAQNQGPSARHILGTDDLGRDMWSRLLYGARVVLVYLPISEHLWLPVGTAIWGVALGLLVGTTLGLMGGYLGGWIDEVVMRLLDAMMAFPVILLYMIIIAAVGASATNVVLAIAIVGTPGIARLVRSLALDIRTRDYIRAAETRGENPFYIMFVEILPNARGPIIIDAMLRVGYAIFAMGTLGFLGLGLPPPSPDWGSMVAAGRRFILAGSPWAALWPSLAIATLVVGLNLLADGLREESLRYQ
jgi:peptide/nickel transport system permease protein